MIKMIIMMRLTSGAGVSCISGTAEILKCRLCGVMIPSETCTLGADAAHNLGEKFRVLTIRTGIVDDLGHLLDNCTVGLPFGCIKRDLGKWVLSAGT